MSLLERAITLVPMRNVVLLTHVLMPIIAGRAKSVAAVLQAAKGRGSGQSRLV